MVTSPPAKQPEFWKAMPSRRRLDYTLNPKQPRGRPVEYSDPQVLLEDCLEYIQWCHDNPLIESKPMVAGKEIQMVELPRMRACTLNGLQLFLRITAHTWARMCGRPGPNSDVGTVYADGIKEVCQYIEQCIWEQKFVGAAADMLNPNVIMRALGLAEKQELSGPRGGPVQIESSMTPTEAAQLWAEVVRDDVPQLEDKSGG